LNANPPPSSTSRETLRALLDGDALEGEIRRARDLLSAAAGLATADRAERWLRGAAGLERASSAALAHGRDRLADLLYRLALALFADAVRESARVLVLDEPKPPAEIRRQIAASRRFARSLARASRADDRFVELADVDSSGADARRESRRACEAAIALSAGRHLPALELLAGHLVTEGDAPAALPIYDRLASSSRSAERARSLSNRGKALLDLGRSDAACRSCEEAIRLLPEHGYAHANLGVARLLEGDVPGAVEAYERADAICVRDASQRGALPRLVRADLRWARGSPRVPRRHVRSLARELRSMPFLRAASAAGAAAGGRA